MELKQINVDKIKRDKDQPRKNFDAQKLNVLKESIKKFGVMTPVMVENRPDGNYKLIDGERRYRASKDLGLDKIPATIQEAGEDRVAKQYHTQEQREGWSATEKALAIKRMSEKSGMTMRELGEELGLDQRTISEYLALSDLMTADMFVEHNIGVSYSRNIRSLIDAVRKELSAELDYYMDRENQEQMEENIINSIVAGHITSTRGVTRIKDAFLYDPESAVKYCEEESLINPEKLFQETGAGVVYHLRNAIQSSGWTQSHLSNFLDENMHEIPASFQSDVSKIRSLKKVCDEFLTNYERAN